MPFGRSYTHPHHSYTEYEVRHLMVRAVLPIKKLISGQTWSGSGSMSIEMREQNCRSDTSCTGVEAGALPSSQCPKNRRAGQQRGQILHNDPTVKLAIVFTTRVSECSSGNLAAQMSATKRYTATISLSICTVRSLYVTTGSYAGLPSSSYLGFTATLDAAAASPTPKYCCIYWTWASYLGERLRVVVAARSRSFT
ncbi:hypothetical protein PC116_g19582 [Phytophthora cactorum]|nr:hypothetical protein PC116_g19582 [Phytophthora cactorum]